MRTSDNASTEDRRSSEGSQFVRRKLGIRIRRVALQRTTTFAWMAPISPRHRRELRVRVFFGAEELPIPEVHTRHAAPGRPVVPPPDRGIAVLGFHFPARDRLAEELGDLVLRHALLEREELSL